MIKSGAKLVSSVDDILEELNLTDLKPIAMKTFENNLSKEETLILKIIGIEPLHVDKICEITKMPMNQILSTISMLEIQGIIKNIGGKFTVIK